jgi:hypothetical protein
MKNSFRYLLGEDPENMAAIEDSRGLKGSGSGSPLITIIGGDGQQSFWEIFGEAGIVVHNGKVDYGFMERWNMPNDLNTNKRIKMPKERIEKEIIINRLAYEALARKYDVTYFISKHGYIGPGGGVRDLQTNKAFSGKKLGKIFRGLSSDKRYAFDLEVSMIAGKEGEPIYWGVRKDYGEPAPLGEGWKVRWGKSAGDKLDVIKMHSGMRSNEFKDLIMDVIEDAGRDVRISLEIANLVLKYGRVDTEI